ncbi:unnamed protein product [Didymodactylos carnosus]|uniref:Uncharacterized protein n=1 Tax=Didymodactylos carnosus TaxID=1234261 RepID=A0A815MLA7_9BILA|nr:unnamed protein product [Didymodactylos carnosus]CAF4305834.1 unnamed protein product [Didymodactylos carnosus]
MRVSHGRAMDVIRNSAVASKIQWGCGIRPEIVRDADNPGYWVNSSYCPIHLHLKNPKQPQVLDDAEYDDIDCNVSRLDRYSSEVLSVNRTPNSSHWCGPPAPIAEKESKELLYAVNGVFVLTREPPEVINRFQVGTMFVRKALTSSEIPYLGSSPWCFLAEL